MAQHTKHPVSAPPTAPPRETTGHLLLRAYATFLLVVVFGPAAWQNAVGPLGAGLVAIAVTAGAIAIGVPRIVMTRNTTPFPWRRLPWASLGFVVLAVGSILWSQWRLTSLLTGALLVCTTVIALFLAVWLTWRELLTSLASAMKWLLGLSLAFELWVSVFVRHPILPNFVTPPAGELDPQWYWSRDNLLDGGRIQGIVGNANLLAALCLVGIIVFALRIWVGAPRRSWLIAWIVVALFLFVRAQSATILVCGIVCALVLVAALLMRRASGPRARGRIYLVFLVTGIAAAVTGWLLRMPILDVLGRSADLTGRERIWQTVLAEAAQRPWFGWGHASPWLPWDPAFDGWIIDHGMTVMQAHSMWVDSFFQLGIVGLVLVAAAYATLVWRAWFFAVDRPRWDLDADRPYSHITLLPTLLTAMLLVQGLTESGPLMLWGWMLLVLFSFKIKAMPLVGVGLSERSQVIERGEHRRRVP